MTTSILNIEGSATLQEVEVAAVTFADFGQNIYRNGAPAKIQNAVKTILIDQIGLQLACSDLPWCRSVVEYMDTFGSAGSATIVASGTKVHPEHAAFANATFGHGQDFDDTCQIVQTHAGAVVLPVAIAVGEQVGASGEQVLRAATAGLEVMLRVAHAVSPDCLRRGHHTPPAAGPFGAALAAGLLLGLSRDQLIQAIAIAGSFSGGLIEYTQSGGSVKRIHTAIPTTAGIRAAGFAQRGLTGPVTVLDGRKGFCAVFADEPHVERLADRIGDRFLIEEIGLKVYNCCYFIHAPLEALMAIMAEDELGVDDIVQITVGTSAHAVTHVGSLPHPRDALGGQFSTHFTLAMALAGHLPGIDSYTDEQLADPHLHALAERVHVYEDATAEAEYPSNWGAVVTVIGLDGRRYDRRVRFPRGTPSNPLSEEELWEKFLRNTRALPAAHVNELRGLLGRIESVPSIFELTSLLAPESPVTP